MLLFQKVQLERKNSLETFNCGRSSDWSVFIGFKNTQSGFHNCRLEFWPTKTFTAEFTGYLGRVLRKIRLKKVSAPFLSKKLFAPPNFFRQKFRPFFISPKNSLTHENDSMYCCLIIRQLTHPSHLTQYRLLYDLQNGFIEKWNLRFLNFVVKKVFTPPLFFSKKTSAPPFFPLTMVPAQVSINFDPSLME